MSKLTLHPVDQAEHLVYPGDFHDLGLNSSALTLFTDFKRHDPLVVEAWMTAADAAEEFRQTHTHLRLVVDRRGEFVGTITRTDLSETNLLKRIAAGEPRREVRVMDLMRHRHQLRALSYRDLQQATVGDVVETLKSSGAQHCLVVDFDSHSIRGLIAASDVAKKLHIDIDMAL